MEAQDVFFDDVLAEACQHFDEIETTTSDTWKNDQMTPPKGLSDLERILSRNSPILASLLLQLPTLAIVHLYHSSQFLRRLLQTCPIAWKHLSFRLYAPSVQMTSPNSTGDGIGSPRPSKNYALDQLILKLVNPFSSNLKSLDLDNTAISGQVLASTVLMLRSRTLEHLSVRGCKNVSLKYHLNPFLNVFGLQQEAPIESSVAGQAAFPLALKSLYTYRCRHHRRRPYLPSSLSRRDSDSEPTHELVTLCHKLGIWTDTAWCTTPGNRCFRRKNYVQMRVPNGTPEVWVVFDRLWRSKNWLGLPEGSTETTTYDGRSWEQKEHACDGEALGINHGRRYAEGKAVPAHLRASYTEFVEDINCDVCGDDVLERCEQCSVLMHCAGCRRTLCASCAFDRPFSFRKSKDDPTTKEDLWWAPGYTVSPCIIGEPGLQQGNHPHPGPAALNSKFKWCCTQPIFSGGGGMSFTPGIVREAERVRASPLPRGQGWEDPEFSAPSDSSSAPFYRHPPPPSIPDSLSENDRAYVMSWLLGPPGRVTTECPRNLCSECYDSETWKVHCKTCSKPLCMEHDLRGLKLRICGFKDLGVEKVAIREQAAKATLTRAGQSAPRRPAQDGPVTSALQLNPNLLAPPPTDLLSPPQEPVQQSAGPGTITTIDGVQESDTSLRVRLQQPLPLRPPFLPHLSSPSSSVNGNRPPSTGSIQTMTSRSSSPSSLYQEPTASTPKPTTPDLPTWTGCLSFFCPSFRTHGDMRPRCSAPLKECASCSTFVCSDCITNCSAPFPAVSVSGCKCSGCTNQFFCPNCMRKRVRGGECKLVEEERREREEKERKEREAVEEKRRREKSDWLMGIVGEFWERWEGAAGGEEVITAASDGNGDGDTSITGGVAATDVIDGLRRHLPRFQNEAHSINDAVTGDGNGANDPDANTGGAEIQSVSAIGEANVDAEQTPVPAPMSPPVLTESTPPDVAYNQEDNVE